MSNEGWKPNRPPKNHYDLLGVKRGATLDEITKAFRALSKKHHPDAGGNAEKFKRISAAYETLKKDKSRREYDEKISRDPSFSDESYENDDTFSAEEAAESVHAESPEVDPAEPDPEAEQRAEEELRAVRESLDRRRAGTEAPPDPEDLADTVADAAAGAAGATSPGRYAAFRSRVGRAFRTVRNGVGDSLQDIGSRLGFLFAVIFSIAGHLFKEMRGAKGGDHGHGQKKAAAQGHGH